MELRAAIDYQRLDAQLTYWRTQAGLEVDFVFGDAIAIEDKATQHVSPSDLKTLHAIGEELRLKKRVLVSREPYAREVEDGIHILPLRVFCEQLWDGTLLSA